LAKRDFAQNNKLAFKKEIAHPASMVLEMLPFCRGINERAMGKKAPPGYPSGGFYQKRTAKVGGLNSGSLMESFWYS